MMTRKEALDLISDVEKFYCESADKYGYYCYKAENVIDKIYDSFEEAMKPKTCKGCKYNRGDDIHCYVCDDCSRKCIDRYESKKGEVLGESVLKSFTYIVMPISLDAHERGHLPSFYLSKV